MNLTNLPKWFVPLAIAALAILSLTAAALPGGGPTYTNRVTLPGQLPVGLTHARPLAPPISTKS